MPRTGRGSALTLLLLTLASIVIVAGPARAAATITVDDTIDEINTDGSCSLREAVKTANTNTQVDGCVPVGDLGDDTIQLGSGATYTLTKGPAGDDTADAGDLDLTGNTTILGGATSTTIIQVDRNVMLDRVFDIPASTSVNLSGFTIKDGKVGSGAHGGGIRSLGSLRLEFVAMNNNESVSGVGGGIYANGSLTVLHSSVNSSTAGGNGGGGIAATSETAAVLVSGSSFLFNQGSKGGAVNTGGPATIEESTFASNTANQGGALYSSNPSGTASLTITDSIFFNNSNGAISNSDTLSAERVLLRSNTSAGAGTAFTNNGNATFTNSTISGNSSSQTASAFGSSIWTDGSGAGEETTTLRWTTVSDNQSPGPGGALTTHNGTLVLENSILANSSRSDTNDTATNDCSVQDGGTVEIVGTSIVENPGDCEPDTTQGSYLAVDPRLKPLEDYGGGPLLTHALRFDSPALDAGPGIGCPSEDMRSSDRPVDGPDSDNTPECDIGSHENDPPVRHDRAVSLVMRRHLRVRGRVTVADSFNKCRRNVPVVIQRRTAGKWVEVEEISTSLRGRYKAQLEDRTGKYRAVVTSLVRTGEICTKAVSPRRNHRH